MINRISKVKKRNGRIVEFDKERIVNAIFRAAKSVRIENLERAKEVTDEIVRRLKVHFSDKDIPTVEEIQNVVVSALYDFGEDRTAEAYQSYREQRTLLREQRETEFGIGENIPYKILYQILVWNIDHNCDSVEKLNEIVRTGKFADLVKAGEEKYHEDINSLTSAILRQREKIRVIIIAGPSSSSKTTTTIKLGEQLAKHNIKLVALNLDNYFRNLDIHTQDEFGDYDFERPEALDIPLINEHLADLLDGKIVQTPYYNFKTGKREWHDENKFNLKEDEILLLDSLHGLYEPLTASVSKELKFKFYIEAFCQVRDMKGEYIRWADLRMFRRMVRDSWHRSYNPEMTVGHWHYVRKSEMRHIIPYINTADFILNGSLPYELPVHRKYLDPYLDRIFNMYKDDVKRFDAAIRAKRIYNLLKSIVPITDEDEKAIPANSLLREFIGGSIYKY